MNFEKNHVANAYARFPVNFISGKGAVLTDTEGKKYVDFVSGIAVCSLGHCEETVVEAIKSQAETLMHVSNLYWNGPQLELAEMLCSHSFGDRVFFCNSGAEAVEAAIKLARRRGHLKKGPDCHEIVCLEGSFHGRTLTALSATGQPVYQNGFQPLTSRFTHIPPDDTAALELAVGPRTAAVMLEPILGEGGVRPLSGDFLAAARKLCDRFEAVLIFDEVQVGMGRTGSLFAYEQTPVVPDVMCLAKALANGFPIGAVVATEAAMEFLPPGTHASTFGGNPLACAAATAVLKVMTAEGFLGKVGKLGDRLRQGLEDIAGRYPDVVLECRGAGLIQAMELKVAVPDLAMQLLDDGFLVLLGHGRILRLLPPFTITEEQISSLLAALEKRIAVIKPEL